MKEFFSLILVREFDTRTFTRMRKPRRSEETMMEPLPDNGYSEVEPDTNPRLLPSHSVEDDRLSTSSESSFRDVEELHHTARMQEQSKGQFYKYLFEFLDL